MKVSSDVLAVLASAQTSGNALILTGALDRGLYERTNKVLEAAGGKWNRKARAHVFDAAADEAIDQIILSGEITIPQDFGFFPTPPDVVERLVEIADVRSHHHFCEPQAGHGNIACAFRDAEKVTCYELLPANIQKLRALGYDHWEIIQADFLAITPAPIYDRIVMNPPFAKQADIKHVTHAHKFLKPGGTLVSVMSAGVTFRTDRLTESFKQLIESSDGYIEDLPDCAFKSSGTMVRTVIVTLKA
jgi:predicted RNA methylase